MNTDQSNGPIERVILIVALALLLFASPVIYWWAQDDSPWFGIYLLWLLIIGLSAWLHFTQHRNDL